MLLLYGVVILLLHHHLIQDLFVSQWLFEIYRMMYCIYITRVIVEILDKYEADGRTRNIIYDETLVE